MGDVDRGAALDRLWPFASRPDECPNRSKHRGPEGPNEDVAQCGGCGTVSYSLRQSVPMWDRSDWVSRVWRLVAHDYCPHEGVGKSCAKCRGTVSWVADLFAQRTAQ